MMRTVSVDPGAFWELHRQLGERYALDLLLMQAGAASGKSDQIGFFFPMDFHGFPTSKFLPDTKRAIQSQVCFNMIHSTFFWTPCQ